MIDPGYSVYKWVTSAAAPVVLPLIWLHHQLRGDDSRRFDQRLGVYPGALRRRHAHPPRIWIHAVSVGEIGVAEPIIAVLRRLMPESAIVVSTMKEHGRSRALRRFGANVPCIYSPLDILGPTRRALAHIRPDVLVCLETEIWPNLIVGARRMGIRTAIVNGRISDRTVSRYRRFKTLMRHTLSCIDAFSMISQPDAQRIMSMGAPLQRVCVNGNAKFDSGQPVNAAATRQSVMTRLGIPGHTPLLVAGSTRYAEEPILLEAFVRIRSRFPDALMIIAPRHVERATQVVHWVRAHGLTPQLRSEIESGWDHAQAPVLVLDTMGELSDIYSAADCVYCGGSLVPKGGQNILEPVRWGKPTLFGPSMEDFKDAVDIVRRAGGGVQVAHADDIVATVGRWFKSPEIAIAQGKAAQAAISGHKGAAGKHAAVIARLLASATVQ